MNKNYNRGRAKEYLIQKSLEKDGWYTIRSAGSHGLADIVALRPATCGHPWDYEVKFIQIKVSEKLKNEIKTVIVASSACGPINLELWKFPLKSRKWHANNRQRRKKKAKK